MARKPRVHYPAALYHVIMRGNARQDIFFDDADRFRFYLLMQEGLERYGHRIHAFCLMANHIHLAIQVGEVPLSRIMQNLTFRYTRWINWKQNRSGHLFQGRFKAVMVDADSYLLELTRYIHLNPVRAKMVHSPDEFPWSGHRAYLGMESIPWLTTDWVLSKFARKSNRACINYNKFVESGKNDGYLREYHRGSANDSRLLGDDAFIDKVLTQDDAKGKWRFQLEEIMQHVCLNYGIEQKDLKVPGKYRNFSEARGVVAWLILETGESKLTELSNYTGRDVSTLSSAARAVQLRARREPKLYEQMIKLKESLSLIPISKA
ncbi:MAG: transposase [Desulfuromonadales bacterium]